MAIFAFGINHKTAPVNIREQVAFTPEKLPEALTGILKESPASEAAIVSTCNRTELYCELHASDSEALIRWFEDFHSLEHKALEPYIYSFTDQEAVKHILRVASGLDSLVLGEPQILGQIKDAYGTAADAGTIGRQLNRLFQHTFSVAKQVRTDTAIGSSPVSVAFAAVSLAKRIFANLEEHTALLIGAGDTIELVARHLKDQNIKNMIVANRTVKRAKLLAEQFNAEAIALADMPSRLLKADIIISSTASQLPILGKGAVESALKARKHRPMFMVDIAVPRDIEAEVGDLRDVYLYTVDDLHDVIEEGQQSREQAAEQAEEIIENETQHFLGWLRSLDAVDTIRSYRDKADIIREEALQLAQKQLAAGKDPAQVLQELARSITNKLVHDPSVQLNRAAYDGRNELLDMAQELFNLNPNNN